MEPSTEEHDLEALQLLSAEARLPSLDNIRRTLTMPSIMGVGRNELAHSSLLAAVLNLRLELHAQEQQPLRNFLEEVAETSKTHQFYAPLKRLVAAEWQRVTVRREVMRIDVVVEIHSSEGPAVIGIENKIDAGEQVQQLSRYQQALHARFPTHKAALLFLTPDGRASETAHPYASVPVMNIDYGTVTRALDRTLLLPSLTKSERILLDCTSHHIEEEILTNSRTRDIVEQLWGGPLARSTAGHCASTHH